MRELSLFRVSLLRELTVQQTTAIAETTIAETTTIEDKLSEKTTILEEIELGLFTDFEDTTALEDKKSLTVFSAIEVVGCTILQGVLSFRSTFGRSTGHNSISSIGSTNISEGSIRSTNFIVEQFNKIYQD